MSDEKFATWGQLSGWGEKDDDAAEVVLQRAGYGKVFVASWKGDCSDCGEPFDDGDQVRYNADRELVGVDCGCG